MPQYFSRLYMGLCPPDIVAIFKGLMSIMDLSDTSLAQIPPRDLTDQESRLKASLTGVFPGML